MKRPWVLIRVPYMNPNILGVIGPGLLNQVPTVGILRGIPRSTPQSPKLSGP